MKDYDNEIAQRQIPLIWNPKQNKYNELLDNLKDAIKLDTLNEMVENHKKEENKYNEYYNNLFNEYDMNNLQNLIETLSHCWGSGQRCTGNKRSTNKSYFNYSYLLTGKLKAKSIYSRYNGRQVHASLHQLYTLAG